MSLNSIDFLIVCCAVALFAYRRHTSFIFYFLTGVVSFFSGVMGVYLNERLFSSIPDPQIKATLSFIFVAFFMIAPAYISTGLFEKIRIRLLAGAIGTIDRALSPLAKVACIFGLIFFLAQTLVFSPMLSIQYVAQGSTILYAVDTHTPETYLSMKMKTYLGDPFTELKSTPDKVPLTYDALETVESDKEVLAEIAPSVVRIYGKGCIGTGFGSGVIIAPNLVMTNNHVVAGKSPIYIETHEGTYPATPVFLNKEKDLAVLYSKHIRSGEPLDFAGENAKVDTKVHLLGFPGGGDLTITSGAISSSSQQAFGTLKLSDDEWFRSSTKAAPGNSGGPVVNEQGKIVGIIAGYDSQIDRAIGLAADLSRNTAIEATNSLFPTRTGIC